MREVGQRSAGSRLRSAWGDDRVLGAVVVLVTVAILATFGILYLRPAAQKTIAFETTDASAITTGQDVRVAGISIGKVTDLTMEPNRVRVSMRVDESMAIGDQSRVEVRMLTPVGGYAITLVPLGEKSSGADPVIPSERVSVPYSIGDVLQSAPTVTDEVDAVDVNANLAQVAGALRANSTSLRSIVDGMNAVTGVFDRQRTQVHRIAALASEYLRDFNANREFVFDLIRKIDVVVTTYHNNSAGFNYTYYLLGMVLSRLQPFMKFYLQNSDLVRTNIYALRDAITEMQKHMGPALDNLVAMRDQLAKWLTPKGIREVGGGTLLASDVCVPIAGREC
ncbi:MlaD family protein [Gordonia soli]|uniref:Mce family protein n=1 Tax=Gordonia soli NBRC 108243 TaxID=1223545 RepID=M0QJ83_9ACTN|nr:MlaD family protein [Gordonia soli]GAC68504.1 Mce family protein [Gordonia soli NBRC 108243]